jgi:hypothetical protein
MRQVGLLALAEGRRKGLPEAKAEGRAMNNAIHALLHPATGPGVPLAWTAGTGKNLPGMKVAEKRPPGGRSTGRI